MPCLNARLTYRSGARISAIARRPDGRRCAGVGGKSGLHGNAVPANRRRGRPQGKCHRNYTARARQNAPRARVKWCGKSAPRARQRERQGKPHREQDRIGAAGGRSGETRTCDARAFPPRRPGWSHQARREARRRGMAVPPARADRTRLTGRLAHRPLAPGPCACAQAGTAISACGVAINFACRRTNKARILRQYSGFAPPCRRIG